MPAAFFRTPYVRHATMPRGRVCAMDALTPQIEADGGRWEEAEIDGNAAIVRVRADSSNTLRQIGLVHTLLSETEARNQHTPTRAKPGWDAVNNRVIFQRNKMQPTKPLANLVKRVPAVAPSVDRSALLGLWMAIGFGDRFRIPQSVAEKMADFSIEPGGFWGEAIARLLYDERYGPRVWVKTLAQSLFDTHGTFPTQGVLDDFNRADEDPLANGNWTGPAVLGETDLAIISNVAASPSTASNSYWSAATFGPQSEVHCTMATIPADGHNISQMMRLIDIGSGTTDGYISVAKENTSSTDEFQYLRADDDTPTQLGSSETRAWVAGDGFGSDILGSIFTIYHRESGTWTGLTNRDDGTYSAAGNIGGRCSETTSRFDDFGGGTVTPILNLIPHHMRGGVNAGAFSS